MTEAVFRVKTCCSQTNKWNRGYFYCPGCHQLHAINIDENRPPDQPTWRFNGSIEEPTVTPDVYLLYGAPKDPSDPQIEMFNFICHSHIFAGKIKFEEDCSHNLANTTLPLPPLPDWFMRL